MKRSKRQTKSSLGIERLKKLHRCRECSIKITRMDFEKILGKFTRVKIQYENSPKPKGKTRTETKSPTTNSRLKSNANGMVLIHRNAYNQHPVKDPILQNKKKSGNQKGNNKLTSPRVSTLAKENNPSKITTRNRNNNVTKPYEKPVPMKFREPLLIHAKKNVKDYSKNKLADLLVNVDESILPNTDWCMDIYPRSENTKDVVYDKIAAELENLMYNEKGKITSEKAEGKDDFPSILDILNDHCSDSNTQLHNSINSTESNFAATDIEAMLLDDTKPVSNNNTNVGQIDVADTASTNITNASIERPGSPSILDEATEDNVKDQNSDVSNLTKEKSESSEISQRDESTIFNSEPLITITKPKAKPLNVTHVIFKKMQAGVCHRSVKLLRTLKYIIELDSKPVELLGAPKFVSNKDDTKTLLEIVDECRLESSFVWDKSLK